jgi:hypothetical protein
MTPSALTRPGQLERAAVDAIREYVNTHAEVVLDVPGIRVRPYTDIAEQVLAVPGIRAQLRAYHQAAITEGCSPWIRENTLQAICLDGIGRSIRGLRLLVEAADPREGEALTRRALERRPDLTTRGIGEPSQEILRPEAVVLAARWLEWIGPAKRVMRTRSSYGLSQDVCRWYDQRSTLVGVEQRRVTNGELIAAGLGLGLDFATERLNADLAINPARWRRATSLDDKLSSAGLIGGMRVLRLGILRKRALASLVGA